MPVNAPADLDAEVEGIRHRWPAVALAVGVVRDGHLDAFAGQGFADLEARTPATAETAFTC
jgi:CubicO group peptidase (beta-lactamase class C family)